MADTECLRVVIKKQREGAELPGVVIFTDCRALVQALGKSGSESVGEVVLIADYLQKTEGCGPWSTYKANDYLQGLNRSDAVQIFRAKAKHTLLLSDRARHGWPSNTAWSLCGERKETVLHVLSECGKMYCDRPGGWPEKPVNDILWQHERVDMNTVAKIMRKFLQQAMQ
ncbi:hypothetical protein PoB_002702200 [Plakobranchus ocellatus]|uniref:Uncharacterized protein n=1 Tax=Plakobranchus ocellatus TaxID=259542 RepID=A0AAV3ZZQ9_9GAST|nr:hypothetical protein PoB_002702200 [Plakobranchus ocellatus]